ncbi:hypothetical protein [Novosphingobium humi]|uniref:hypothetical protein n=1 Tax=Novosphingobium humi TaxID=2282397 RepID=UPI0025AFE5FF|nr:hypothetical protein [Novosphingobium humi]WJS98233.1 hypothetical protein NYQ05_14030 [Novosphingobium humi]
MARSPTPAMRNRLIAAYDHAGDLLRDGFHPLMVIRSLQSLHTAFYGYASCTTKLRCAGVEVTSSWKNHAGMLDAWMAKATACLDDGQAPVRTSEPIPVIGGRDNALGRLPHHMEAQR